MDTTYRLVFRGEILPGHDVQRARERLSHTLKISSEQAAALFSGKQVILRKHLPESEVSRYVRHFVVLGVQVYAEGQQDSGAVPSVAQVRGAASVVVPQPSDLSLVVMAEEVTCPNCGERQPKRTLCRACSVDMNRVAQSQENALQEKRELHAAQREKRGELQAGGKGDVSLFGLSFSGRIGRLDYFLCGLLMSAIWLFFEAAVLRDIFVLMARAYANDAYPSVPTDGVFHLFSSTRVFWIALLLSILMLVFGMRSVVLRCHDNGWSGWLALLCFIPFFNIFFSLVLLFFPGDRGENQYGFPKESLPVPGIILIVLIAVGAAAKFGMQYQNALEEATDILRLEAETGN